MRRIRSKITYANVVATLALFIALGGVSYAAVKLPANSVGEKQLKKNAVTGKKIKKSTITADKIKNGTITGADINIGSLGKVPAASSADVAGSAANQIAVAKRVGPSSNNVTYSVARDAATEVPLGSHGQVSVYGKCFKSGGTLYAQTYSRTTADGALVSDYSDYYYGSPYLNVATTEDNRELYYLSTSGDSAYGMSNYYGIGAIYGPDGNGIDFHFQAWVKVGNPISGGGAYGPNDTCIWMFNGTKVSTG